MTKTEIREVIDAWAAAAVRLKKGGYDGADIPLYGGHLLENFISPLANTRTDEYGGSLDNRLRLPTEVLRALREAVGRDFIIGLRHSGDHFVEGGSRAENCSRSRGDWTRSASPITGWSAGRTRRRCASRRRGRPRTTIHAAWSTTWP